MTRDVAARAAPPVRPGTSGTWGRLTWLVLRRDLARTTTRVLWGCGGALGMLVALAPAIVDGTGDIGGVTGCLSRAVGAMLWVCLLVAPVSGAALASADVGDGLDETWHGAGVGLVRRACTSMVSAWAALASTCFVVVGTATAVGAGSSWDAAAHQGTTRLLLAGTAGQTARTLLVVLVLVPAGVLFGVACASPRLTLFGVAVLASTYLQMQLDAAYWRWTVWHPLGAVVAGLAPDTAVLRTGDPSPSSVGVSLTVWALALLGVAWVSVRARRP